MTSKVSLSSLTMCGTAAQAQSAIYKVMGAYSQMSTMYDKLMQLGTICQYKSSQATSTNIENAADQQSKQLRDQAIGSLVLGGVELTGVGFSIASETLGEKSLQKDKTELNNMKSYQKTLDDRLENPPESPLSTNNSDNIEAQSKLMEERMNKIEPNMRSGEQPISNAEMEAIKTAGEDEVKNLSKSTNSQIEQKERELDEKRSKINRRTDRITLTSNALGQIGSGLSNAKGASHTSEAGKFEAMKTMTQSSGQIMQEFYQQATQGASKYFELALQLPQILTGLMEADTSKV